MLRPRGTVSCPVCRGVLSFSPRLLKKYGFIQIGCPSCKRIVAIGKAREQASEIVPSARAQGRQSSTN